MIVAVAILAAAVFLGGYFVYSREEAKHFGANWPNWIVLLGIAIATAEGYFLPGTWPERHNNPGDITDPDTGAKISYASDQEGWSALYSKLSMDLSGESTVYSPNMTLAQFAQKWTGGDNPDSWASNVSESLLLSGVHLGAGDPMAALFS